MKKMVIKIILSIFIIMLLSSASSMAAAKTPSIVVDGAPIAVSSPLIWDNGSILISIDDISSILHASFQWNEMKESVFIQKYGKTILFKISEDEILKNAGVITSPVKPRFIDETFYVPLRIIAEGLGAKVNWDDKGFQIKITTGDRFSPPELATHEVFNAIIAYTDNGHLWILDGRDENSEPKMITDSGYVELIGWSNDGKWLSYKHYANNQSNHAFLWVVSADGNQNRPVDAAPVYDNYLWSPTENKIIYTIYENTDEGFIPAGIVKCANISEDGIEIITLMEDDLVIIPSVAWYPDGNSAAISIPRTRYQPPTLEMLGLDGTRKKIYTLEDKEPIDVDNIYPWAFISLKWSPDGRYIAYHTRMNSASLTADMVETALLDTENMQVMELDEGLKYPQWLSFPKSGKKFAYIKGIGRDAIYNKQLEIVNLTDGKIMDLGNEDYVSSGPVWMKGRHDELFFCCGNTGDDKYIIDDNILPNVMVRDQRIYRLNDNKITKVTEGMDNTADYYPNPSPDGKQMIFLRLDRYDRGTIYIQSLNEPQGARKILKGIRGSAGYYGNYYPEWFKIYWFN